MRVWTLPEANAALPRVRTLVEEGRGLLARLRDVEAQLADLRIVWGARLEEPDSPAAAEAAGYAKQREELEDEMAALSLKFQALGCDVKDLDQGLVDFRGRIGSDDVFLCWQYGEAQVRYWHTVQGGFANRHEIPGGAVGTGMP